MFSCQPHLGFGFLTFESDDAVNAVCREHFINFNGKKVTYRYIYFFYYKHLNVTLVSV